MLRNKTKIGAYIDFMSVKNIQKVVLVWDSGVGGLSILDGLVQNLGRCKYVYYADIDNAPYGNKSVEDLRVLVLPKLKLVVKKYNPDCIVLACNTITASLVQDIRCECSDVMVVGTEPAIKPALSMGKDVLLMMTPTTFGNCELVDLLRNSELNSYWILDKNLAMVIQNNLENKNYIKAYLQKLIGKYRNREMVVVLGCTHYVLVKDIIREILGKKVIILDSTQGVTNRVKKLLDIIGSDKSGSVEIVGNDLIKKIWDMLRGSKICVE